MATHKEIEQRRKKVLAVLKHCGKEPNQAHIDIICDNLPEIDVSKQTITKDLQHLRDRKALWNDKGSVVNVDKESEWQYQKPRPPSFAAYGIYWERNKVNWQRRPTRGQPPKGESPEYRLPGENPTFQEGIWVCFANQVGIYLLHNGDRTVYVGRTASNDTTNLFSRLRYHHEKKRRWDKFSWFGFSKVMDNGSISENEYVPPLPPA